ncbi:hypothetical protein C8034_v000534 [Colletotrichum sidae]|uniref:Uncharacterized protein n=1 Tax=Colletotrichum sidae TaxID=1347389 RepID=A0A4R8TFZ7_9PEZI|nr:hypothetical protein C8034_v000534 [Colletotrichum sidae]
MGQDQRAGDEQGPRRKPVPSYVPPLAYDEALLLASADARVYDFEPDVTQSSGAQRQDTFAKDYKPNSTFASRETEYELVTSPGHGRTKEDSRRSGSRRRFHVLRGWWPEIVWCIVSIVCIIVLVVVLHAYDGQPLPNWPSGLTLNTVVAFISTFCRTSFVLPVMESLSQYKWNWYKSPRPLADFRVFDEASRGPWGSLKLLVTTKGRLVGILAAVILVSGIATSTLTQSVVTYPTARLQLPGNDTALTRRNDGYFWASANSNSVRDVMFPVNQAVPRSLYTPPEEAILYHQASCSTSNCTWPTFTSLAVCVDMKNVTELLDSDGDPQEPGTNSTLPNGLTMQRSSYGYNNMNISTGTSLSYNNTDLINAKLFNFFVIYGPTLRATEIMLHWCVNTYNVTVQNNVPVTQQVASHTKPSIGEVFVESYNMTVNGTYLTSPDNPEKKYVADGLGIAQIESILSATLVGYYINLAQYTFNNGTEIFGTALSRAGIQAAVGSLSESQALDDAQFTALRNLTQNIATGLTNALLTDDQGGSAWQDERFVSIRWPWLTLLAAQVGLSIVTLLLIMFQTACLDIDIVKGSPLPALLAINPMENIAMLREQQEGDVRELDEKMQQHHLRAHGIVGALGRKGDGWVLSK